MMTLASALKAAEFKTALILKKLTSAKGMMLRFLSVLKRPF